MKKFLISLIALVLFGCTTNTETQGEIKQKSVEDKCIITYYNDVVTAIYGVEIEGHQYIIYSSGNHKGNIIHAEHCPCHDKK